MSILDLKQKFKEKESYLSHEINNVINIFYKEGFDEYISPGKLKPKDVRKGDIFFSPVGGCYHPSIVIKVENKKAYYVGLTTDERMGFVEIKSRLFDKKTYFTKTISHFDIDETNNKGKFLGTFDNRVQLNKIINQLRLHYNSIL